MVETDNSTNCVEVIFRANVRSVMRLAFVSFAQGGNSI